MEITKFDLVMAVLVGNGITTLLFVLIAIIKDSRRKP